MGRVVESVSVARELPFQLFELSNHTQIKNMLCSSSKLTDEGKEVSSMADTVFIFHKSFEQRLEEFTDVLCSRASPVLASEIADEWSFSLEAFIEPTGWQALWKISRQICEELHISFPRYVFVKVIEVDFHELTALVEVERVQDDISIPAKQDVPLVQLYPTKIQEETELNIDRTANLIDQLRFFYNHLWHPWEWEIVEGGDWPSKHLEPRLKLFFEMSNGAIPVKLADKIHKNREQARKLHEKKQKLESLLQQETAVGLSSEDVSPTAEDLTYELMQINLQLNPLMTELQILEDPSLRKMVVKRFLSDESKMHTSSEAIIVWQNGLVEGFIDFLTACKSVVDAKSSTVSSSSLVNAIESAASGSTILLYKGVHFINQILEFNLSMIGVGTVMPEISGKESHSYLFSVRNASIQLKNLKLNLRDVASALEVVRNSSIELINCCITNQNLLDGRGIIINSGAYAVIDSCKFSGLHVALCCYPGSRVSIKNSSFQNCVYGIETSMNSTVQISGGVIANCQEAGIFVSQNVDSDQKGTSALLEKCKNITTSQLQMIDNGNDVVIQRELCPMTPHSC